MAHLISARNEKVARIAGKEIQTQTTTTKKAATRYRHDIADLTRQVCELVMRLAVVAKHPPTEMTAPPAVLEKARYRVGRVKTPRAKLGLLAANKAKLVGVSGLSLHKGEAGKPQIQ